jgi:hypothetical protein
MITLRDVSTIADAQRHVPLAGATVQHFQALGIQPADLHGAIQNLATLLSCDPTFRAFGDRLSDDDVQRAVAGLLTRLQASIPIITAELLRQPELVQRRRADEPSRADSPPSPAPRPGRESLTASPPQHPIDATGGPHAAPVSQWTAA